MRVFTNFAVLFIAPLAFLPRPCQAQTAPEPALDALLANAADSKSWKTDALAYCRRAKEQIESNRDEQLIHSSIAISHFDLAMEAAASADSLSQVLVQKLLKAAESRHLFESGQTPDFAAGLNKLQLKRFAGDSVSEFVLLPPPGYRVERKWPLFIEIDPRRRLPYGQEKYLNTPGMVNLWWHWPQDEPADWKDFQTFFDLLKTKLSIDENRIYMAADCANGVPAMDILFHHPDLWAECIVSVASSHRQMAGNASNLPFFFLYSDVHQGIKPYYDFAAECFEYNDCSLFRRREVDDIHAAHAGYVPSAVRRQKPTSVKFTTDSLAAATAYWVKIEGRDDENFPAQIEARIDKQKVEVKTDNISAYKLLLSEAPIGTNSTVEVVENGKSLGFTDAKIFEKRTAARKHARFVKNENLHGPVTDIFTDRYAVICGSSGDDGDVEHRIANALANGAPLFADIDAPEELPATHNIVLVATGESNTWISRISNSLPVRISNDGILADGKRYEGPSYGAILIYPNPLNPNRYVAVLSGLSEASAAALPKAYSAMKAFRPADVGVFEVGGDGDIKWHICERFSTVWGWHDTWKQVIAVADKQHTKMKWLQLFGRAIRLQLDADAAVCEDPFLYNDPMPTGELAFRDLNNLVRNEWMVKIKIDGSTLKRVLTTAFTAFSDRRLKPIIVDGISFGGDDDVEDGVLSMNSINDTADYTLVVPENVINGQRAGIAIENYEIVDDGRLVLLVRDFLFANKALGLDALMQTIKPTVF